MPPTQLTVQVGQDSGGVTTIICEGELDLATVSQLAEALAGSFTADLRRLHIDATKVSFCDSAGLRCMLAAAVPCHDRGVPLTVATGFNVGRLFQLCGLDIGDANADRAAPISATGDGGLVTELTEALNDIAAAKLTTAAVRSDGAST